MARKKVVLFIVEGITDKESLELLLTELIKDNNQVIFELAYGDITSDGGINSSNIKSKITDIIKGGGKRKFRPTDYREIIHLVDMDGAFISEDNIYLDESLDEFSYRNEGIYANNIEKVVERNNRKQQLLNLLCSTNIVYNSVPYRIFYFSSNLEHVLHNKIEIQENLKIEYAEEFQERYIEDLEGFVNFICESDFTVKKEYKESWNFIKRDNNSIKRYTNFNIVLEDYLKL